MMSVRTKEGPAVAKSRGVRLGVPVKVSAAVERRIRQERNRGITIAVIAGGSWSHVSRARDGGDVRTCRP